MEVIPTLSERIDQYLATAPGSKPWYDTKNRRWHPARVYVTKRAVMALFLEYRRARAQQAMAELAAEEAAERRRLKRKTRAKVKRQRTTR